MNALRICAALLFFGLCPVAYAQDFKKDDLVIGHPWTRATPEGATVGAGYLKITNNGKTADRFTGGTFDGAENVEIHEMKMAGDKMTMRRASGRHYAQAGRDRGIRAELISLDVPRLEKADCPGSEHQGNFDFRKSR